MDALSDTGIIRLATALHETTVPAVDRICASRDMNDFVSFEAHEFHPELNAHRICIATVLAETHATTYRGTCGSSVTEADLRTRFGTDNVELAGGQWKAVCRG
jgi:hypothetical protein